MAVRSSDEILNALKEQFSDNTSDEALGIIEDISDTLASLSESEDWKSKYENNDKEWRKKYRDRFFSGSGNEQEEDEEDEEDGKKPLLYENLFKIGG